MKESSTEKDHEGSSLRPGKLLLGTPFVKIMTPSPRSHEDTRTHMSITITVPVGCCVCPPSHSPGAGGASPALGQSRVVRMIFVVGAVLLWCFAMSGYVLSCDSSAPAAVVTPAVPQPEKQANGSVVRQHQQPEHQATADPAEQQVHQQQQQVTEPDAAAAAYTNRACSQFNRTAFHARVKEQNIRFLSMEPMRAGYGFTNQLMVYSNFIAYSMMDTRTLLLPESRTRYDELVSVERSRLRPGIKVVLDECERAEVESLPGARMKSERFNNLRKFLARGRIGAAPNVAHRKLQGFIMDTRHTRHVKIWEMYGRFPYGAKMLKPWITFPWFLCGIAFADTFETQAAQIYGMMADAIYKHHQSLPVVTPTPTAVVAEADKQNSEANASEGNCPGNATHAVYVAVHLRMEPQDMFGMGRSWSDPEQVAEFFTSSVFPIAREKRTRTVLICSGKLHPLAEEAIQNASASEGFQILRKSDFNLTLPPERFQPSDFYGVRLTPTSTFGAVVDLLLLERAAAAVLTGYSSLTAAVYSRRCCHNFTAMGAANHSDADSALAPFGGGPTEGNVYMYDVYNDGSLTEAKPYPCGLQLEDHVVGHAIPKPPPELKYFDPSRQRTSALFADHPDRNEHPIRTPPGTMKLVNGQMVPVEYVRGRGLGH